MHQLTINNAAKLTLFWGGAKVGVWFEPVPSQTCSNNIKYDMKQFFQHWHQSQTFCGRSTSKCFIRQKQDCQRRFFKMASRRRDVDFMKLDLTGCKRRKAVFTKDYHISSLHEFKKTTGSTWTECTLVCLLCVLQALTALYLGALPTSTSVEELTSAFTWANCATGFRTAPMAGMKVHTAEVPLSWHHPPTEEQHTHCWATGHPQIHEHTATP